MNFSIFHFNNKIFRTFLLVALVVNLLTPQCVAQKVAQIPRDTSFTVYSAWKKELKRFPGIKIVRPAPYDSKRWDRDVVYKTIKDTPYGTRKLHADVFHPVDDGKLHPAILLLHGGGWSSGNKSHMYPMAQHFADHGFVALAVEYRLSDEAKYPAAVIDVKNAIRWVRRNSKRLHVDPNKIALLGCSAGGQLAGLVAVTPGVQELDDDQRRSIPCNVQAVVSMDGIVSFIHPEAASESSAAAKWLDGTRETNYENWKSASALEYVNDKTPSFGFVNSSIPRFHAGRDDMMKKLEELNIYTEMHTIPDTPHPFWLFDRWFDEAFGYSLAYLQNVFELKD